MKVVLIVGPTGSGKSHLAIKWAKAYHGHILNADSVQLFQSLHIGANKPSLQAQKEVPHHLFNIVKEGEHFTAGDFRRVALKKLATLAQQKIPYTFIVGGSGFYLQALLKGMYPIPKASKERQKLTQELKIHGLNTLYKELEAKDPIYAKKVHPKDTHRILRAVEILRVQPKTITNMTENFQAQVFPYPYIMIGLQCDRIKLKETIEKRTGEMLASGLIEEVHTLIKKGRSHWHPLQSVGYKQVLEFLEGKLKREDLLEAIVKANMQLAKKQMTWFKNKYKVHWINSEQCDQYMFLNEDLYIKRI